MPFDPYHKWLGIPPKKQPPTIYQLLGISLDEEDAEVIRSAASRQRSHIEQFEHGPRHQEAIQLLYQIDEAEVTLLSPQLRRDYDRRLDLLRKRKKRRQVVPVAEASPSYAGGRTVGEESGFFREYLGIMSVILGGFVIMAVVSFYLPWQKLLKQEEPVVVNEVEQPQVVPQVNETPGILPDDEESSSGPTESEPKAETNQVSDGLDLIPLIVPQRHSIRGGWQLTDGAVVSRPPDKGPSVLQVPYRPSGEYVLKIVARNKAQGGSLIVGLVFERTQFAAFLNSADKSWIKGLKGDQNNKTTRKSRFFRANESVTITCTVRKKSVIIESDQGARLEWRGDYSEFTEKPLSWAGIPDKKALFLGVWGTFQIDEIRFKEIVASANRNLSETFPGVHPEKMASSGSEVQQWPPKDVWPKNVGRTVRLFDGRSFSGWVGDFRTWRIDRGRNAIISPGGNKDNGFCTAKKYKNFILQLEYRTLTSLQRFPSGIILRKPIGELLAIIGSSKKLGRSGDLGFYRGWRKNLKWSPNQQSVKGKVAGREYTRIDRVENAELAYPQASEGEKGMICFVQRGLKVEYRNIGLVRLQ